MATNKHSRNWRNFAWWIPVGILFGVLGSKLGRSLKSGDLGQIGGSELVAAAMGITLLFVGLMGIIGVARAHMGARFMDPDLADEMRERARLFLCSFTWVAACGLLFVVLSLAGPGGVLSQTTALASALALVAVLVVLGIATWRLSDELLRTLSYEGGNLAFYLIFALGGGWAILAHLGLVVTPAPLDWLTMLTMFMLAGSFIAAGRRNLLRR